jgi:phosphoribosylanthranilate isomerase
MGQNQENGVKSHTSSITAEGNVRTRIKICGITRADDGLAAAHAGADAIGLVFYNPSPRAVTTAQARAIIRVLPPFVTTVGLFVDATADDVNQVLEQVPLDLLQFHGNESPDFCAGFGRPYLKAIRMQPGLAIAAEADRFDSASGILLDTYSDQVAGGSGETFDWDQVPTQIGKAMVLAGGLTISNVADAVRRLKPFAVDVSSGVEREKGIKDPDKINAFIQQVTNA